VVAWPQGAGLTPSQSRAVEGLWQSAKDLARRQRTPKQPDPALKASIVKDFWLPLYALALELQFTNNAAACERWLQGLRTCLELAGVRMETGAQRDGAGSQAPGACPPHDRPALIDADTGKVLCAGTVTPQPARELTPAAVPDIQPLEELSQGNSAWHAAVRDLFAVRGQRIPGLQRHTEYIRQRDLLLLADQIDSRQQFPDEGLRVLVAEKFWVPFYALADKCYGLSRGHTADGDAWLQELQGIMGMVQLQLALPDGDVETNWFREPLASDEPVNRPAVIEMHTRKPVSRGTRRVASAA
jgi:hypothetical protein